MRLWKSKLAKMGIIDGIEEVVGEEYDKTSMSISYSIYVLNCVDTHTILTNYPEILGNVITNRLLEAIMDETSNKYPFAKGSYVWAGDYRTEDRNIRVRYILFNPYDRGHKYGRVLAMLLADHPNESDYPRFNNIILLDNISIFRPLLDQALAKCKKDMIRAKKWRDKNEEESNLMGRKKYNKKFVRKEAV
mgnify:CR=1 FL=1